MKSNATTLRDPHQTDLDFELGLAHAKSCVGLGEAATLLQVSERTVRNWLEAGQLCAAPAGAGAERKHLLITRASVLAMRLANLEAQGVLPALIQKHYPRAWADAGVQLWREHLKQARGGRSQKTGDMKP